MASSETQKKAIYFFAFVALLTAVLIFFPSDDTISNYIAARLGLVLQANGSYMTVENNTPTMMAETTISLVVNILRIIKILLWMTVVVTIVRFVFYSVTKALYRKGAPGEVSSLLQTVVSVIIYIVAFFIIFQTQFPGVQLAPLFTGSTIIGIVVGLALQDTLGNLFAGLALQADQPFQVGDVVIISNRGEGVVESVSWRGVKIRTFQNKLLVISNSVLGKETIEVAPRDNLNAKAVFFNTLYSHSPTRTIQFVREAVRQVENVSKKMRPVVRIRNLGESGIDFEVKYWLDDYTMQHDTDALIRQRIWYVFQREHIGFAYPTRTLHIEPKPAEVAPEEIVNSIAESLNRIPIFNPLSDGEIEQLANASTSRVYAPGEAIVRAGQVGNSMFVIISGSVKVQITENDYQKTVNTLAEDDFFGEMSLLTGEPRSANVIAIVETEVLRIDKNGLRPILEANPDLVSVISEMIEERKQSLVKQVTEEEEQGSSPKKGAINSIRKFFGLK
ncbi:MAG: mechanosensitive ion channel family protein [Pyrinomonadaceae bacterium]